MKLLRIAVLVPVLAAMATPAVARDDTGEFDSAITLPSAARADAVRMLLKIAAKPAGKIEKLAFDGVQALYDQHDGALLWLADGSASPQMQALRREMDDAAVFGLSPDDYAAPVLTGPYPDDPQQLAAADVAFSRAAARFVMHISSGRIDPADISNQITLEPEYPDVAAALERLSGSTDVAADIATLEPPHPQYAALKAALAKLRADAATAEERIVVPDGALLKPGKTDSRVPTLRSRLDVALPPDADPEVYDDALVDAVKAFQDGSGLNPDGIVGPRTLLSMNGRSPKEEIAAVIANMERWRWMPRDLGDFNVFVNVPEFMVRIVDQGTVVHETRVVVGKPENPTPTFSNAISHLVVNPYWNVPVSILSKEMMPEIRADPYGYFARQGYEVLAKVNGKMQQVDPRWIDWYSVNPNSVRIRQIPGDANALGRIKFMFPNKHSVYLHDTPSKSLFRRDSRAFSHGCVRVENPLDFADVLLAKAAPKWNSDRLQKLFGGAERRVNLDEHVPVHLAYFTEWVSDDGELRHFEDIYGYDGAMGQTVGY